MKKVFLLLMGLYCSVALWAASPTTYSSTAPGSLSTFLKDNTGVTDLIITGPIDARDFRTIRSMNGLQTIDLSGATIVEYTEVLDGDYESHTYPQNAIPAYALYPYCTSIVLPSTVTEIGERAFIFCSGLTGITIPASVKIINGLAFYGCSGLNSIFLNNPEPITLTGYEWFSNVPKSTSLYVPIGSSVAYSASKWNYFTNIKEISNNALNFDASRADNVLIEHKPNLNLTTNYTIEAWIKPSSFSSLAGIVSKYQSSSFTGFTLRLSGSSPFSGINFNEKQTANNVLVLDQWQHIAAVCNAGTLTLYINGKTVSLSGNALTINPNNTDPVRIGCDFNGRLFNGSIDEVRIWNVARSQDSIVANMNKSLTTAAGLLANYTFNQGVAGSDNTSITTAIDVSGNNYKGTLRNFIKSGSTSNFVSHSTLIAHYPFNGDTYDKTGNNHHLTRIGNGYFEYDADRFGKTSAAASFPSKNYYDYLIMPSYVLGGRKQFSVTFWINTKESGVEGFYENLPTIFGQASYPREVGDFQILSKGGKIGLFNGLTSQKELSVSYPINDSVWHFVACTYNGNSVKMFVDGVKTYQNDNSTNPLNAQEMYLMASNGGSVGESIHTGILDDFRVYDDALLDDEIAQSFNAVKTPKLSVSTTNNALAFDGTDDYVEVTNNASIVAYTELTMEAWINPTNTTNGKIFGKTNSASSKGYSIAVVGGQLQVEFWDQDTKYSCTGGQIPIGKWSHIAATWKTSGNIILYINGEEVARTNASTSFLFSSGTNARMGVAAWNLTQYYSGLLDEVRIWRIARSQIDIITNMHKTISTANDLLASYSFNQGLPNVANTDRSLTDATANNNIGTLSTSFALNGTASNWTTGVPLDYTVNPSNITMPLGDNNASYASVTSNIAWTATSSDSWLSVSPSSATGNGVLAINAAVSETVRTATITLKAKDAVLPDKTITVTQPASKLTVPATVAFNASTSLSQSIKVESNLNWTISNVPAWLNVSPLSGTTTTQVTVTASENTETPRTATITVSGGGLTKTITVTQKAVPAILWTTPAAITYETKLSTTQLNASTGSIPGTFVYSPALNEVLGVGTHTLSLTFTPTDAANYETNTASVSLKVTKAEIIVTADAKSKIYGDPEPALTYTSSPLLSGNEFSGTLTRQAGETVGSYIISQNNLSAGDNYSIVFKDANFTVTPKPLTITGASVSTKIYDGTNAASIIDASLDGVINSDDVKLNIDKASFSNNIVGLDKTVNASFSLTGTKAANYSITTNPISLTGTITAKALTIKADAKNMIYGEQLPSLSCSYDGFVSNESPKDLFPKPSLTIVGTVQNAGKYLITVSGANSSNYDITFKNDSLTVSKAILTARADDKSMMAGTVVPPLTISYSGFKYNDTVKDITTLPIASTTATSQSSEGSYLITLSAGNDDNYDINTVYGTLTIGSKFLPIVDWSGIPATITYGDSLGGMKFNPTNTTQGTFSYSAKKEGATNSINTKTIVEAGEYTLIYTFTPQSNDTAIITNTTTLTVKKDTVLITPTAGQTKVYGSEDGELKYLSKPLYNGNTFTGALTRVAGDSVGTYTIRLGSLSAGNNYFIKLAADSVAFSITKKQLNITVPKLTTEKEYDGNKDASVTAGVLQNIISGDNEKLTVSATAQYEDSLAGDDKTITVQYTISGDAAKNYIAPKDSVVKTGRITPKALTISKVTTYDTIYNGSTAVRVSSGKLVGVIAGDEVSVQLGTASFSDSIAAENKPVTLTRSTLNGAAKNNYSLIEPTGLTATISKKQLTITAHDTTITQGDAIPTFRVTYSGFVNNETANSLSLTNIVTTTAIKGSNVGIYPITFKTFSLENYRLDTIRGKLTIIKRTITHSVTRSNCDTIQFDGKTYTSNTDITKIIKTDVGNDSTVTYHLLVSHASGDTVSYNSALDSAQKAFDGKKVGSKPTYYSSTDSVLLHNAIDSAIKIRNTPCYTAANLQKATDSLRTASKRFIASRIPVVDRTALNAAIEQLKIAISDSENYTADLTAIKQMLLSANEINKDSTSIAENIATVTDAVNNAIKALKITLSCTPKQITVGGAAKDTLCAVISNYKYSKLSDDWISFSNNTLHIKENTGTAIRTGKIVFTAKSLRDSILITQDAPITAYPLTDITIISGQPNKKFWFNKLFSYSLTNISYSVVSSNIDIVTTDEFTGGFALVSGIDGKATLTVSAKSAAGSEAHFSVKITVTSGVCMTLDTLMTHPQCSGDSTGRIVVTPTNGTAPFFYSWSNFEGDSIVDHLPAGKYRLTVTDATGCNTVRLFTIKQGTQILLTPQLSAPKCETNTGAISVSVTGGNEPYRYQWAGNSSELNSISNVSAGLYILSVTDKKGCKASLNIQLNDEGAPQIIVDSVKESPCGKSLGAIYTRILGNYDALRWSNDSLEKQITRVPSQDFTITVTAGNCKSSRTINVPHPAIPQPQLALVSIDSAFKKNLVVWLRDKDSSAISEYRIFRDGLPIVTVPYRYYSVYHDTAALVDPSSQPYTYQIMAINACKEQSPLSAGLTTLYLQANESKQVTGGVDLRWGIYKSGLTLNKYVIYRSNGHNVVRIDSVTNKTMFTDKTPGKNPRYYVALSLNDSIMVSQLKTDTGPFSQSFSNMSEASIVFVSENDTDSFVVYPNPSSTNITIAIPNAEGAVVSLVAANGHVITRATIANGKTELSVSALPHGLYTVQVQTNDASLSKTLIVE